jgi:hypothetical protein
MVLFPLERSTFSSSRVCPTWWRLDDPVAGGAVGRHGDRATGQRGLGRCLELAPLGGAQGGQDDLEALQEPPPIDLPPARIFQSPDMDGPETEPE